MKYWLFEDEALHGPFSPDELRERPRFGPGTLVHPEERFDPAAERWLQAASVPQLALVLAACERQTHEGRFIAPEPAVRDLPVLGAILEESEKLEEALVALRAQFRSVEDAMDGLRADGRAYQASTDGFKAAMETLSARFDGFKTEAAGLAREAAAFREEREAAQAAFAARDLRESESAASAAAFKESAERDLAALKAAAAAATLALQEAAGERRALDARLAAAEAAAAEALETLARHRDSEAERWRLGGLRLSPRGLLLAGAAVLALTGLGVLLGR